MVIFWFMSLVMNPLFIVCGVLLGISVTLWAVPLLYRRSRRRKLHRAWKSDSPRTVRSTLEPRFDEYDPQEPGVDHRCVCHNRSVPEGERVLLWPETGDLGLLYIAVYCLSGIKEPA